MAPSRWITSLNVCNVLYLMTILNKATCQKSTDSKKSSFIALGDAVLYKNMYFLKNLPDYHLMQDKFIHWSTSLIIKARDRTVGLGEFSPPEILHRLFHQGLASLIHKSETQMFWNLKLLNVELEVKSISNFRSVWFLNKVIQPLCALELKWWPY